MNTPPLFIIQRAAHHWKVNVSEILGRTKEPPVMFARIAAIGVCCQIRTDLTSVVIGRCFRGREHSTILHAKKRSKILRVEDADFEERYVRILDDAYRWEAPKRVTVFSMEGRGA